MGIKRFFKELFQSQREREVNELLNELHDSGVIKIEGRENPTFDPSVLEIEEIKKTIILSMHANRRVCGIYK